MVLAGLEKRSMSHMEMLVGWVDGSRVWERR